jgi:hypothetical protein
MKKLIKISLSILLASSFISCAKNNKNNNNQPANTNNQPDNTNNQPDNTNNQPDNTNNQPDNTNNQPDNTNNQPDNTNKEFSTVDRIYTINSQAILHGENTTLFEKICNIQNMGSKFTVNLQFLKNTTSGKFVCNNQNIAFEYDAQDTIDGTELKLRNFNFPTEAQKKFSWGGSEYSAEAALTAPIWFYNKAKNTIEAVMSFDPTQLQDVQVDFQNSTIKWPNETRPISDALHYKQLTYLLFNI